MAGADEFLGLTRQGDDVVPEDADADVVKVIVRKGCCIPLLFRQRVAFIAPAFRVEYLPAAFCRIIDGILIVRNEVIERRIERALSRCQIEHITILLARPAHAAATTSCHVCMAGAFLLR